MQTTDLSPLLIKHECTSPAWEILYLEVMRQLKQNAVYGNIPVIFLTASQDSEHLLKAFELGAVDYLTKPFQAPELLARIKTHLELKQLRDRIFRQAQQEWFFGQITKSIHDSLC